MLHLHSYACFQNALYSQYNVTALVAERVGIITAVHAMKSAPLTNKEQKRLGLLGLDAV
jgi:hypothetical protein